MAAERSYKSTPRTRRGALTTFGSRTDIGCLRDHNEDSLVVAPAAVRRGRRHGRPCRRRGGLRDSRARAGRARARASRRRGARARRGGGEPRRHRAARDGRGREGMGTTMTAAVLEGERLVIAQVGDSRAYLLHQGKLQQLTRDHSLMADMIEAGQLTPEEARTHPQRSVITRALGSDPACTRYVRDQRGDGRPPAHLLRRPVRHALRPGHRAHACAASRTRSAARRSW